MLIFFFFGKIKNSIYNNCYVQVFISFSDNSFLQIWGTDMGVVGVCVCFWCMLQGMYKNDFLGLTFKNFVLDGVSIGPDIPGSYVVEQIYGIQTKRGKWADFWILFGMIFAYRLIFFICIKLKEHLGPMVRSILTRYRTNKRLARRPSELQNVIRPVTSSPSPAASPMNDCTPLQRVQW